MATEGPAARYGAVAAWLTSDPRQTQTDTVWLVASVAPSRVMLADWDLAQGAAACHDPALASHARQLIRAMVDPGPRTIADEVEQSIRLLMPAGRATISGVADTLGTNVRTLQRRLDREETSFSELLDRVRVQQVSLHFANRSLRLTDVAHLLGYSTLASFSAWYRSRFHETPTKARAKAQADRIGARPPQMCEQTIGLPLDMPSNR